MLSGTRIAGIKSFVEIETSSGIIIQLHKKHNRDRGIYFGFIFAIKLKRIDVKYKYV